ncbi:hypothetical protein ACFP3T_12550 [Lactiplantibacillus dongliensis]|uniref:Uncharacterized protein n=1 Tax=Lactiplantibacillus dongliensis TaxID=2559919 RepID=A0ABW1RBE2_9LACO|nr:hypothetical protein [Lactiplantibacillus dongliensis]
MIGHVTKINISLNQGILTDFHGRHFKFALSAAPPVGPVQLGEEFYFTPELTAAGLTAIKIKRHHHDGTRMVVPVANTPGGPRFVRIGEIVVNLAQIQYYEMSTTQNELRNGYETTARHLLIQMKGGRQFNFYNWDSINIDEVLQTLEMLHTENKKLG